MAARDPEKRGNVRMGMTLRRDAPRKHSKREAFAAASLVTGVDSQ
jgi:hypothetical protein